MEKLSILLFLVLVLFFSASYQHMQKPMMFDEVQYARSAEMVAQTGRPVSYYWAQDYKPWMIIIAHPTLYVHMLSWAYRIIGRGDLTSYLFGLLNAIIAAVLMCLIIKALSKDKKQAVTASLIALILYFLNPLLTRGCLIVDIDSTILMTLLLLFIFLAIKNYLILLPLAFALSVWAKETTTILLIPSVFLWIALSSRQKKARLYLKWSAIFLSGGLIFLVSWLIYCRYLALPAAFPLEYTAINRAAGYFTSSLYSRITTIRNDFFWLSPFLVTLGLLAIAEEVKTKLASLTSIFILAIISFYMVIFPTTVIAKYVVVLVPLFSITVSLFLYRKLASLKLKNSFWLVPLALGAFIYYKIMPDPLLILLTKQDYNFKKILIPLFYILPLLPVYIVVCKKYRLKPYKAFLIALVLLLVASQTALNIKQARASYATFYHYGEEGLGDTIDFIEANIGKGKVLFGRKEFDYYLPDHYVYFDATGNTSIIDELVEDNKISYAVFSDYYESDKKIVSQLDEEYPAIYRKGNFRIYKLADN